MALVRVPQGDLEFSLLTRFEQDSLRRCRRKSVSLALTPQNNHRHGIESGDYASRIAKDYFQKPPSNVAGWSPSTTLYGTFA